MYQENVIKKIPGIIPPPSKKESQGYLGDLDKKSKVELLELLERQVKLLNNKSFISKLPDKGAKIREFHDKVQKELDRKNEIENAANLLSRLNIACEGKAAMSQLEWTGEYSESTGTKVIELDSDDEEDPLKILAQPTGSGVHKKKIVHLAPEESLITKEDLKEIESFDDLLKEEHMQFVLNKVENSNVEKEPFKPYKTTKSNVHDPMKEKDRRKHKYWEVTAATPPLIIHGAAKTLSLNESLMLQKEQADKLKAIELRHTAERLAERIGMNGIGVLPNVPGNYRSDHNKDSDSSDSDNEEEHEVHDEEDTDKAGTVVFTVDSEHL